MPRDPRGSIYPNVCCFDLAETMINAARTKK
jgi:hypothetical protein